MSDSDSVAFPARRRRVRPPTTSWWSRLRITDRSVSAWRTGSALIAKATRWWLWGGCGLIVGTALGLAIGHSVWSPHRRPITAPPSHQEQTDTTDNDDLAASLESMNPMSWTLFKAKMPRDPVEMACLIKLDDYYNYEFEHRRREFWSIAVYDFEGDNQIHGYWKREPDKHDYLVDKVLGDGQLHMVKVRVNYSITSQTSDIVHDFDILGWYSGGKLIATQ